MNLQRKGGGEKEEVKKKGKKEGDDWRKSKKQSFEFEGKLKLWYV